MSIILSNLNFRIPNIQDHIHYNFHTQSDDCILLHAQSQSDSSWLKCYCWRGSRSVEEYSRKPLSNAATWGKFVLCVFFVLKLVLKLSLAVISQLIGLLISRLPSCSFYSPYHSKENLPHSTTLPILFFLRVIRMIFANIM